MNNSRIEKIIKSLPHGLPPGCIVNRYGLIQRVKNPYSMKMTDRFVRTVEHTLGHEIERDICGYAINTLKKENLSLGLIDEYNDYALCICGHIIHNIMVLYTENEPVNYGFIVGKDCVDLHIGKSKNMKKKVLLIDIYTPENVPYILEKQNIYKRLYQRPILLKLSKYIKNYISYRYNQVRLKFNKLKSIWQSYKNQITPTIPKSRSLTNSDKIDVILKWAEINLWFNPSFVLSLKNHIQLYGKLTIKQENSLNKIISSCKINI